ncbi:hypothetical protein OG225_41395 (plasmid) [Nocardia sp. NBC_01377]|uniref:hypothetical protein n=1 Tax=Nocardia sp. NBC_01377 TaxID=2903595 RepID=UPI003245DBAE
MAAGLDSDGDVHIAAEALGSIVAYTNALATLVHRHSKADLTEDSRVEAVVDALWRGAGPASKPMQNYAFGIVFPNIRLID